MKSWDCFPSHFSSRGFGGSFFNSTSAWRIANPFFARHRLRTLVFDVKAIHHRADYELKKIIYFSFNASPRLISLLSIEHRRECDAHRSREKDRMSRIFIAFAFTDDGQHHHRRSVSNASSWVRKNIELLYRRDELFDVAHFDDLFAFNLFNHSDFPSRFSSLYFAQTLLSSLFSFRIALSPTFGRSTHCQKACEYAWWLC